MTSTDDGQHRAALPGSPGQAVVHLVNEEVEAGPHEVRFDGSGLASGVYYYCLQARPVRDGQGPPTDGGQARDYATTKKLLLLR